MLSLTTGLVTCMSLPRVRVSSIAISWASLTSLSPWPLMMAACLMTSLGNIIIKYYRYCLMITCTEPAPHSPGQCQVSGFCSKASQWQCFDSRDCHECHEHYSFMSRVWQRQGVWSNWNTEQQRKLATDGFTRLLESGDSCFILGVGRKYPPNRWPSLRQFSQQKIKKKII